MTLCVKMVSQRNLNLLSEDGLCQERVLPAVNQILSNFHRCNYSVFLFLAGLARKSSAVFLSSLILCSSAVILSYLLFSSLVMEFLSLSLMRFGVVIGTKRN